MNNKVTVVTGIWDIGRNNLTDFGRPYQHYRDHLAKLLAIDNPMIIFCESSDVDFILQCRAGKRTVIWDKPLSEFNSSFFPFFDMVQNIRLNETWSKRAGWLSESPQAKLEYYNPIVMSKMFMLHDASISDPFGSDFFVWIDGAITNTVNPGYFTHDKVIDKLPLVTDNFFFVCFDYRNEVEVHGFETPVLDKYCMYENNREGQITKVARGGVFGGTKASIKHANNWYYNFLQDSLTNGYMGTEECIFTIMHYHDPEMYKSIDIDSSGLLWQFFEYVKDLNVVEHANEYKETSLYVLSYNAPDQFSTLCNTLEQSDIRMLTETNKYLINNSTDRSTDAEYNKICRQYGFAQMKQDNLGICGGRQFAAEHFDSIEGPKYYIFFEDDMFMHPEPNTIEASCRNGLRIHVNDLLSKSIHILNENKLDYLKLTWEEFYGDNTVQWAWYNIPSHIREKYFPGTVLPERGLSKNPPLTEIESIKRYDDLSYAIGEFHYCNWPILFSREGNVKTFINTKWERPYEQTWMSHVFQMQKNKEIKAGCLLLIPISHDRFNHYKGERKES